jgi:hypothetical protein
MLVIPDEWTSFRTPRWGVCVSAGIADDPMTTASQQAVVLQRLADLGLAGGIEGAHG